MKTKLMTLALGLVLAQNSYATGGFFCSGETHSGKKVSVSACVPHGIPGLCSSVSVTVNDKEVLEVPKNQVPAFYISGNFLGLTAMDEEFSGTLVNLEYFGAKNKKNSLEVNVPNGASFKFKDVTCELE